jgi:hypothetical protein
MSERIAITVEEVLPDVAAVLKLQGFTAGKEPNERVRAILDQAVAIFGKLAEPVGILEELTVEEFSQIYSGEGNNEPETPLEQIYPQGERLALFAVTVGEVVSARIQELFRDRDFALAGLLDSVASEGTDCAAEVAEKRYGAILSEKGDLAPGARVLRYSPGYCGWHVSGQKKLFARLNPGEIGITLRESCLMVPLKSISGVIVSGPREIHEFDDDFPFCPACRTRSCRMRLQQQ